MKFSANFYSRIVGSLVFGYAGYAWGQAHAASPPTDDQGLATSLLTLCGIGMGLLLAHHLTLYPWRRLLNTVQRMTADELLTRSGGVIAGLLVGVLLTPPLSRLPALFGSLLPVVVAMLAAYVGMVAAVSRRVELARWFGRWGTPGAAVTPHPSAAPDLTPASSDTQQRILLDTSVIVDGRIGEVVRTGFVRGPLVVPQFVLGEVQHLADSHDDLTRAKGKRGLDILRMLQANPNVAVEISAWDAPNIHEVDDKLVALARAESWDLLTNDNNLEHVARLQQVRVLNLNALQAAIRTTVLVGDRLRITIRNEGRERAQGLGFLPDGTMLIVEDARHLIGSDADIIVTRVYTTSTGRILFAQLDASAQPATHESVVAHSMSTAPTNAGRR